MSDIAEHVVEARAHGRYLVRMPTGSSRGVLVGFHGYAEDAAVHLDALRMIPGSGEWLLVAVQALHPFYAKQQRVVASWMTSQQREHAIADNIDYVGRVLRHLQPDGARRPLVFAGFSQGGAMAYRAAASYPCDGVLVLAADVPPDVAEGTARLPRVLIGRGTADQWYTEDKHAQDRVALRGRADDVESCVFDGGHEWGTPFLAAAGQWLAQIRTP